MDTLLSTGEVARRLGSSRQHVVDLCDRGDLPFVRVGKHRRVPESALQRLLLEPPILTRDQERSLWLHRAVAGALVADPDGTLATARMNLSRWRGRHRVDGMAEHWLMRWETLLDSGIDDVAEVLTRRDPEAVELRQNSPFAGVLDEETRKQVLAAFSRHWRQEHPADPAA